MAVMVDAVDSASGIQQGSTGKKNHDSRVTFIYFIDLHSEIKSIFHIRMESNILVTHTQVDKHHKKEICRITLSARKGKRSDNTTSCGNVPIRVFIVQLSDGMGRFRCIYIREFSIV